MIQCKRFTNEDLAGAGVIAAGTRVTYSRLSQCAIDGYETATYSIKYVLRGTEHYTINKRRYSVGEKQFLVVNRNLASDAEIKAGIVEGLCLHFEESLLQEAFAVRSLSQEVLLDSPDRTVRVPELQALIYSAGASTLGQFLLRTIEGFDQQQARLDVDEGEFYHTVVDLLAGLQSQPYGSRPLAVKSSVQQELLSRLHKAKARLDAYPAHGCCIDDLATDALLSPSHFFHSFKKAFGVSPYRYGLGKRLERADEMLRRRDGNVTEIALGLGFADLASFSKAYKKKFGCAPSRLSC